MIVEKTFYGVECDRCGEEYDGGDISYWSDWGHVRDMAVEDDWLSNDDKHYCPGCYTYVEGFDDEGSGVPLPPFPDHVKELFVFIDKIVKGKRERPSYLVNGEYSVTFRKYNGPLKEHHKETIEAMLGCRFVSIEQNDDMDLDERWIVKVEEL